MTGSIGRKCQPGSPDLVGHLCFKDRFRDDFNRMNPTVPPFAYAAVLLGAMLHAGWNVAVRRERDRAFETALVVAGGAVLALLILPFLRQHGRIGCSHACCLWLISTCWPPPTRVRAWPWSTR